MKLSRGYEIYDMETIEKHQCFDETIVHPNRLVQWRDFMKSIVVKLIQMIGFHHHQRTYYTKQELVEDVGVLFQQKPHYMEAAKYYLFRAKDGIVCVEFIKELLNNYIIVGESCASLHEPVYQTTLQIPHTSNSNIKYWENENL